MPSKFDKLLDAFQSNSYPAMYEDLALHLGVSADSLSRLGLGWAPVVPFKKGLNFDGWWANAERDAEANIIGLGLRSQSDQKVMYPGSKHGLIYEVNPNHSQGSDGYNSGPHNWIRTSESGLLCPICQKPDGCLLSVENPRDPKAVVCIRESTNARKSLRFGYLHIRKSGGEIKNSSPLCDSPHPALIVEGWTDVATALDLGFVGVGRPSNLAGMDLLRDLLRGRSCVVLGENDKKENGKEPGREGMLAAFQTLKHVCRDIKWVMPPEGIKDLRAWKINFGLTQEILLNYIEERGQAQVDGSVLENDRPRTIVRAYLDQKHRL